jgi:predicted ATP-dependent endonuclease of OLD family
MIRSIRVNNFQSLRDVSIELGKFTVITGSTNKGKSALIRAVKAVVENRRGDGFIFTSESFCSVWLDYSSGSVGWVKQQKKSATYLCSKVELSKQYGLYINFQNQLDAPFLLAESDIVKSKVLGEITNATLVLISINQIKRWASETNATKSIRLAEIVGIKAALEKYKDLDVLLTGQQVLQDVLANLKHDIDKLNSLRDIFKRASQHVRTITALNTVVRGAESQRLALARTYFGSQEFYDDTVKLVKFEEAKVQLNAELNQARKVKRRAEIIEQGLPDLTEVEMYMSRLNVFVGYKDAVGKTKKTEAMLDSQVKQVIHELNLADDDMQHLRVELKVCPLCEAPLVLQESP